MVEGESLDIGEYVEFYCQEHLLARNPMCNAPLEKKQTFRNGLQGTKHRWYCLTDINRKWVEKVKR